MYKVSVIVIACFIVVAGVVLILPTSEATAQSYYHKDRDNKRNDNIQMMYSVPESHVWELNDNHLLNKATGELYYLANDRHGNRKLIKYTKKY